MLNNDDTHTVSSALRLASAQLRQAGVANDVLDAQMLLAEALGQDRTYLVINFNQSVSERDLDAFNSLIYRRAAGEPLQYILGRQEFYGLEFEVTPEVLIPRPETELIVEETLRLATGIAVPVIIEVGTGSGCIAITLARELSKAQVWATEISEGALAIARQNASKHGLIGVIQFVQCDLLTGIPDPTMADFIVSNPPYVAVSEMPDLQREVRDWEPAMALTDNADGLTYYRRLLDLAPQYLRPGGHLILEVGYNQAGAVRALAREAVWNEIRTLDDLAGIERTLVLRRA